MVRVPRGSGRSPAVAAEPIVLVHGLWMTGLEMALLEHRLRRCGFQVYRFHYRSIRRNLAENAARLHAFAETIPGECIHWVGHSLGGLLIRRLFLDFPAQRPGRIVTLGTPHQGSCVAGVLAAHRASRWVLGRSCGPLTVRLPPWPGERELGVLAGKRPVGVGRLFGCLSGANDGTVALAETTLSNATDSVVLPVTHTGMLFSAPVVSQVCQFLRHGRFGRLPDALPNP